jgi:hypothetical protein
MKQIETLQLIRARCVELLEQAKLRTPGAWEYDPINDDLDDDSNWVGSETDAVCNPIKPNDAAYIANASVAFEAALLSTIDAIDTFSIVHRVTDATIQDLVRQGSDRIITAWKHLLP